MTGERTRLGSRAGLPEPDYRARVAAAREEAERNGHHEPDDDPDRLNSLASSGEGGTRGRVVLTAASSFRLRRVRWLWDERLAIGTLALLAGPEGLGKSTMGYWVTARITRGELPGERIGHPQGVIVCATEDSWEHTIVPRLLAADADLRRVFRVEVHVDELAGGLTLPADIPGVEQAAYDVDAALLLLDPLMSRLSAKLDTHRDGEVRRALEPLGAMLDRAELTALGLIHHNKGGSTNPLDLVMASKAFTAVARSVHTTIRDPDDETGRRRLFGTPKNNLGRDDLPTLSYTVETFVYDTDDGPGSTGQIVWGDEVEGSISDHLRRADESAEVRNALSDAVEWLARYMADKGPTVPSEIVKADAAANGIKVRTLHRARSRLRLEVDSTTTWPRQTFWTLPA